MAMGRLELLALFLEITNEAAVVARVMGDPLLSAAAATAALAAGEQIGLSDDQISAMQRDMANSRFPGTIGRLRPDLVGPGITKVNVVKRQPQAREDLVPRPGVGAPVVARSPAGLAASVRAPRRAA